MANLQLRRRGGPDDNPSWQLRVRLAGKDYYEYCQGTRGAAEDALAAFADRLGGEAPSYTAGMTFCAFAETWIGRHCPSLAGQTAESYRAALRLHLLPAIGAKRLGRISTADGLRLQERMNRAKFAPGTVEQTLRLGRAILADAVKHRAIRVNPWAEVQQKQPRRVRRDVLAPEQFHRLAEGKRDDLQEILLLALASGMRRGEILGLRWRDVSGDFDTVNVSGSLEIVVGTIDRTPPKTESGYRSIGLPADAAKMLRERYLRTGRPEAGLPVFAGPGGGWMSPDLVSQNARNRLRKAGLAPNLHALRHAHATALLSAGVSPQAVANRLGHADVSITLSIYGHTLPTDDRKSVSILNAAFAA